MLEQTDATTNKFLEPITFVQRTPLYVCVCSFPISHGINSFKTTNRWKLFWESVFTATFKRNTNILRGQHAKYLQNMEDGKTGFVNGRMQEKLMT